MKRHHHLYIFILKVSAVDALNVTIKLSGHILFPSLDSQYDLSGYVDLVRRLKADGHNVYLVVGGGEPARYYIKMARQHGADESTCDQIGITVACLNARIMAAALGDIACPFIPTNFDGLDRAMATGKVVLLGGLQPGQSTNAVAGVLAERSRSELLVNTTTVDGVYSKDPRKDPAAKKFNKITADELAMVLDNAGTKAGEYALLDPVALKIIKRSRITTKIIDGRDPMNVLKAIRGDAIGTTIVP
jgi:uridylate kinase